MIILDHIYQTIMRPFTVMTVLNVFNFNAFKVHCGLEPLGVLPQRRSGIHEEEWDVLTIVMVFSICNFATSLRQYTLRTVGTLAGSWDLKSKNADLACT